MAGKIGPFLFAIGIMVAISGGAKVPEKSGQFPDTVWVFLLGTMVAIVGVVMWHIAHRKATKEALAESTGEGEDPLRLLESVVSLLHSLEADLPTLDGPTLCSRLDEVIEGKVLPFAEVRGRIVDRFGMTIGAEILVTVAYGERLLNRVWSAAADGHLEEARTAWSEARGAFDDAWKQAREAAKAA